MSNTFTTPPDWNDPQALVAGARYKTAPHARLCDVNNYLHAYGNCGPVYAASFFTGSCKWDSTATTALTIIIPPAPSTAHNAVYVRIQARSVTALGSVDFASVTAGDTLSLAPTVSGTFARFAGSIDVDPSGDKLTMSLTAGASGVVHVQSVTVEYIELGSPLAATKIGTWYPRGATRAGADYPLPTSVGKQLRASAVNQLARTRAIINWAGLEGIASYSTTAWPYMPPHPHVAPVLSHTGASAAGRTYTARVRAKAYPSDDSYVRILAGQWSTLQGSVVAQATFAADVGEGTTTQDVTFTLPERLTISGLGVQGCYVGIFPAVYTASTPTVDPSRSTAKVEAICIWGY